MAEQNDARIKALLAKVEEQETELAAKPRRASLITNGVFPGEPNGKMAFNLNTVSDVHVLVNALALISGVQRDRSDAAKALEVEYKFSWGGYSYEDWKTDFKERIQEIERIAKKKILAETKKKLNALVSEEARTANDLDDIAGLLG